MIKKIIKITDQSETTEKLYMWFSYFTWGKTQSSQRLSFWHLAKQNVNNIVLFVKLLLVPGDRGTIF